MRALSFRSSAFAVKSAQWQQGHSERQQRAAAGSMQASQRAARACLKGGIFALGHEGSFLHVSNLPQLGSILAALPLQLLLLAS